MLKKSVRLALLPLVASVLVACGGGGGSGSVEAVASRDGGDGGGVCLLHSNDCYYWKTEGYRCALGVDF